LTPPPPRRQQSRPSRSSREPWRNVPLGGITFPEPPAPPGGTMLLIREIMHCKPGKVRELVKKFLAMDELQKKMGMPRMKVMTDLAAERYWTVIAEMEVENLTAFEKMFADMGNDPNAKEFETIMKGYHDLVDDGRREIYKIETTK
jgi:hypothetical protein